MNCEYCFKQIKYSGIINDILSISEDEDYIIKLYQYIKKFPKGTVLRISYGGENIIFKM